VLGRALVLPVISLTAWGAAGRTSPGISPETHHVVASIAGTVYDSLVTSGPLANAEVTIEGTDLIALTDNAGRFRIDAVPVGKAVLRFYHPTLDSLGFGAAPVPVTVPDSGSVEVRLATPAASTLHARLCPAPQPQSTGVVLGRVRDVDDNTPLPNAAVSVSWAEWNVGAGGLTRTERRAAAVTDATGAYIMCGVPADVPVVARAVAADHVTGLVEIDLGQRPFGVKDLAVSTRDAGAMANELARLDTVVSRGDSASTTGTARLAGTVRGPDGRLLDQAQVAVYGFPVSVRTNSDASYALTAMPAGSQTIEVRAVGFSPKRLTVALRTGERRTLDVTLDKAAQTLSSVNIVGRGTSMDRTGYESRRKAGIGQFITEEEIARRGVFDTEQVLSNVLGARVIWNGSENVVRFTRPSGSGRSGGTFSTLCAPAFWVDGIPMPPPAPGFPEDVNTFVKPRDIRGIEVYTSPRQAPPQYRRPDVECGVVMIWTKAPRPKQLKQPSR
jgi:hypothetical protein